MCDPLIIVDQFEFHDQWNNFIIFYVWHHNAICDIIMEHIGLPQQPQNSCPGVIKF